jgi:hypothetical protein
MSLKRHAFRILPRARVLRGKLEPGTVGRLRLLGLGPIRSDPDTEPNLFFPLFNAPGAGHGLGPIYSVVLYG